MKLLSLALLCASVARGINAQDLSSRPLKSNLVPGAYMVELSSAPTKRSADVHDDFLNELDKRASGKFVTRKKYNSPIFNGIAIQLHTPADLVDLASIPNVVAVRPIVVYSAPEPINLHVLQGPNDPAIIADGLSTHIMTGVDKVHAQGISGKGIKVGIIDSGVDYLHPNLGGGFGAGFKIAGGTDLVGDDYTGLNDPVPDADPRDTCGGHGTHVAGIVAASGPNEFNVTGVAPDASIYAYRIFGCEGGVADDVLVDGLLRAYNDGMDIITMSLGVGSGFSTTTPAVVASRIAESGTVLTIAAGNDGDGGSFFFSSPATGEGIIAVGSVENVAPQQPTILVDNVDRDPLPYFVISWPNPQGQPLVVPEDVHYPIYAISSDPFVEDAACEPLPDDTPDLSGYAVVLRGATKCDYLDQYDNVADKGAQIVILYNSTEWLLFGFFLTVNLWNDEDGIFLVNEFNKGTNLTITFPQHGGTIQFPNAVNGGLMSSFSSYGPSNDVLFKPSISTPGGNITSTWLTNDGSFAVLSGTSMATPFAAGAAALVMQAKGKGAAKNMRTILQSTAASVPFSKAAGALPQTLAQQGAGLINVFEALKSTTEVSPGELLLNDTANWKGLHAITIKNTGKKVQTYTLSHIPAGTTVTIPSGQHGITPWPVPLVEAPASIHFSQTRVTVLPGLSAVVLATITPPKSADSKTWPILSGWINIRGSAGDNVKVSYMGVGASMKDAQTLTTGPPANIYYVPNDGGVPAMIPNERGTLHAQRGPRNYTLDNPPVFAFVQGIATHRLVFDLIAPDSPIKSTIPNPLDSVPAPSNPVKRAWSWWWPGLFPPKNSGSFDKVATLGRAYEFEDLTRNAISRGAAVVYTIDFPIEFANGTAVPFGQYKLLVRSLRVTGNPSNEADYDVYVSEQVGLVESL
ncbi:subtilisin-like protein [Exidia glandulosa HHB12029]|uniref:Subtilisin-like protein n=1 Tax=Exidia glandulosa HHB12029 TaxID=1314781 RepID=A0A165LKV5_EXIGL|nr:subtilisin-like protein [Exidia glandulosa HHB12029]